MQRSNDIINGLPNIVGSQRSLVFKEALDKKLYASISNISFKKVKASFGIALHMHQPMIPASAGDLKKAALISNLQYMLEHQHIGDNHNAPVFYWCYHRMADFIPELVSQGKNPRVMLDYSGNLLWGLRKLYNGEALEKLKIITCDKKYYPYVEWLGTMWSHAVVTSTPVPDVKLHILAWRKHFMSIFGKEALMRVRGFSAPEMHLPIHPDVCYMYIKALKECGYKWLLVQEHTIENLDGSAPRNPYFPHRLIAKNSEGKSEEITVLIKTQGSDTKLVGQMQPYSEAKTKTPQEFCAKIVPPYVVQISDGENGGVMMNEFPPAYKLVFQEVGTEGIVAMNGSEYLEFLEEEGLKPQDYPAVQPVLQHKIWRELDGYYRGAVDKAIQRVQAKEPHFNLEKGSWTNDRSWVKGYEHVLNPINKLSAAFHKKFDRKKVSKKDKTYHQALLYLLLSQSSDFRYWGTGLWTDYAQQISRRGFEALGIKAI